MTVSARLPKNLPLLTLSCPTGSLVAANYAMRLFALARKIRFAPLPLLFPEKPKIGFSGTLAP
jgi:hypothetical protein